MASFHPNQPNGQHKCENCGAIYNVTWKHLTARDADKEDCHCCRQPMASWNATSYPVFELVGECPGEDNVRFIE